MKKPKKSKSNKSRTSRLAKRRKELEHYRKLQEEGKLNKVPETIKQLDTFNFEEEELMTAYERHDGPKYSPKKNEHSMSEAMTLLKLLGLFGLTIIGSIIAFGN